MTDDTHTRLIRLLREGNVAFRLLDHIACRTSAESAAARAAAGVPGTVGAKALLLKTESGGQFAMAVLPGSAKLANDVLRRRLGKFRFASSDEVHDITLGLLPGMIPPFGAPLFPQVAMLFVDAQIFAAPVIGFNAARFEQSVVMSGAAYATLVPHAEPEALAKPAA